MVLNQLNEELKTISSHDAIENKLFGPVYHGTYLHKWDAINKDGFKIFIGANSEGQISHGYANTNYYEDIPPPIHHLGYGVYFTTKKSTAKVYAFNNNIIPPFYLKLDRIKTINFATNKNMMNWWIENGYDPELAKQSNEGRVQATKKLTEVLSSKYDAIWYKGGSKFNSTLDGDQIVVFNPDNIYKIDNSNLYGFKIGAKVKTKNSVNVGAANKNYFVEIPKNTTGVILDIRKINDLHIEWLKKNNPESKKLLGDGNEYKVRFNKGGTVELTSVDIEPVNIKKESLDEEITAYHGTAHDFDNFSSEKVGSGKGIYNYGWGLYFTDREDIADSYAGSAARKNDTREYYLNSVPINYMLYGDLANRFGIDTNLAKRITSRVFKALTSEDGILDKKGLPLQIQKALTSNVKISSKYLYTIKIHQGKTPDQYLFLDWDKPVDSTTLNKIIEGLKSKYELTTDGNTIKIKIGEKTHLIDTTKTFQYLYEILSYWVFKDEKLTSLFLLKCGIDGVKYTNNRISRNSDGYSYVVFDPNAITIQNKSKVDESMNESITVDGIKAEKIVNFISQVISKTLESNPTKKGKKEYSFKTLFSRYKKGFSYVSDFITEMFKTIDLYEFNPKVIVYYERPFSYSELQKKDNNFNGGFNSDTYDIILYAYKTDNLTKTISHEVRHLYDEITITNDKYDNYNDYDTNPYEIRARLSGFINQFILNNDFSIQEVLQIWSQKYKETISNKRDFRKIQKIILLAFNLKKEGKLHDFEITPKIFKGRESDVSKVIQLLKQHEYKYKFDKDKRILYLTDDILNTVNMDGQDITYPILDLATPLLDKGISIAFTTDNYLLGYILKNDYKLNVTVNTPKKYDYYTKKPSYFLVSSKLKNIPYHGSIESDVINFDKAIKILKNNSSVITTGILKSYLPELILKPRIFRDFLKYLISKNETIVLSPQYYEDNKDILTSNISKIEQGDNVNYILNINNIIDKLKSDIKVSKIN